jgi:hypothetical protein
MKRIKKILTKVLSSLNKNLLKSAIIQMIQKHHISPDEMQNSFKIPMIVITSDKSNRHSLTFYLIKLFEQIISLKLRA